MGYKRRIYHLWLKYRGIRLTNIVDSEIRVSENGVYLQSGHVVSEKIAWFRPMGFRVPYFQTNPKKCSMVLVICEWYSGSMLVSEHPYRTYACNCATICSWANPGRAQPLMGESNKAVKLVIFWGHWTHSHTDIVWAKWQYGNIWESMDIVHPWIK